MQSEGRVYERGKMFWIAYYANGQEYRESAGRTKREAQRFLRQRLGEKFGGRFVGPQEDRLTVEELLAALTVHLETRGAKALDTLAAHIKPIRAAFGPDRARDVSSERVERFISARLAEGKARATVNREVSTLKQAFNLARKQARLSRVPYIPMLTGETVRQGFFEADEFDALRAALPSDLADVALFAYLCGWRRGEILPLTWEQVDRKSLEIRLATSKNGRGRVLPLDGALWELIEHRWIKRQYQGRDGATALSPLVFHRSGEPIGDFRKVWAAACVKARLGRYVTDEKGKKRYEGKLFHDFRRTCVRNLIRSGVPETVAMSITGHRTRAVFDRYNISSEDDKRTALRKQEKFVSSQRTASVSPIR